MKTEELLEFLESVDTKQLTVVEIHGSDCYVGIQLVKREFPSNRWFRQYHHYGDEYSFNFGGRNRFFNRPIKVYSSEVKEVYADFDEENPHRGIIVRIYLKGEEKS